MSNLKLSNQGNELIKLYEAMVVDGYNRADGIKVGNTYNSFELQKFRDICKEHIANHSIKTVLDYGAGGSDWDAPNFEPTNGESAKQFFDVKKVTAFEPSRNQMKKIESDCVVCMDVLEHIFITDVPNLVDELFSLTKKLLVINVACYKALALLPNGENAHITVRGADWWKGVIDSKAVNYPEIKVLLICSQDWNRGVFFEPFKSKDWHSSNKYFIDYEAMTFKSPSQ